MLVIILALCNPDNGADVIHQATLLQHKLQQLVTQFHILHFGQDIQRQQLNDRPLRIMKRLHGFHRNGFQSIRIGDTLRIYSSDQFMVHFDDQLTCGITAQSLLDTIYGHLKHFTPALLFEVIQGRQICFMRVSDFIVALLKMTECHP